MKRKIGTRTEIQEDSDIAISVKNLQKNFKLPTEKSFGLKQVIFNRLRGVKGYKLQKVLKGISFDVKKGEEVIIIAETKNLACCIFPNMSRAGWVEFVYLSRH